MKTNDFICPRCGLEADAKIGFCPGCGFQQDRVRPDDSSPPTSGLKETIYILILLIVFGITYFLVADRREGIQQPQNAGIDDLGIPDNYQQLIRMANALMDDDSFDEAIEYYERALALDSTDADVITDLGVCYYSLGMFRMAIANFERALNLSPDHRIAHFNLGIVYRQLGEMEQAEFYWKRLLELAPETPMADSVRKYLELLE